MKNLEVFKNEIIRMTNESNSIAEFFSRLTKFTDSKTFANQCREEALQQFKKQENETV